MKSDEEMDQRAERQLLTKRTAKGRKRKSGVMRFTFIDL
jgi:hypothetical protein